MNPLVIRRFEYDTLRIGEEGFSEPYFNRLVAFNDQHKNIFLLVGNRRVIFQNYVGVIQIGALTIEILPKLDRQTADQRSMQRLLIQMLHRTDALPLEKTSPASLQQCPGNLLEIYLRIFFAEIRSIIYQGFPKRYSLIQANERFLRGRFMVAEQIRQNLIHQERFCIEYPKFSIDHRFNQILKSALKIVSSMPSSVSADAKLLLPFFDGVEDRKIARCDFSRLKYTRNTECYRNAITIAELIISNFQPDLQYGELNVISLLFDMNLLFERYVAQELSRAAERCGKDIIVKTQCEKGFHYQDKTGSVQTIRPDILAEIQGVRYILDTKWKLLTAWRSSDGDLKQLYAYSLQYNADHVFLLYPTVGEFESVSGNFVESEFHPKRRVSQWKIPLLSRDGLNLCMGMDVIQRLICQRHSLADQAD